MEKKRITYLDMVKGIGIILVVFGHSTYAPEQVITWMASFHMPLFFMVTGMIIWQIGEESRSLGQSMVRKAKSIMIPYVTFSMLVMIVKLLYFVRMPEVITIEQIWDALYQTVTLYGISVMWFLPALFVSEMIFLALRKIKKGKEVFTAGCMIVLGTAAVTLKPFVDQIQVAGIRYVSCMFLRAFAAFVFVAVGYYIKKYVIQDRKKGNILEFFIGVVLCALVVCLSFFVPRVDMNFLVFGNPFLYYGTAIIGTMGVVLLCKNLPAIKAIIYLGKNSLVIMATHLECQILMLAILFSTIISKRIPFAQEYVFYGSLIAWLVIMEVITIYIFNHYLYFLIGRKKPSSKK